MIAKLFIIFILSAIMCTNANGAEYSYSSEELGEGKISEAWEGLTSDLPPEIAEEISGIDPLNSPDTVDTIKEKSGLSYWLTAAFEELTTAFRGNVPSFIAVYSLILLLAVVKYASSLSSINMSASLMSFGKLAFCITVISSTYSIIDIAKQHLTSLCNVMNLMTPVMEAVYLAEGSLTQMSVSTSAIMLTVTAIGNINSYIMAPCINVLFTMSAVSRVCDEISLSGITAAIRRFIMRVWQIITIGFSFMLGTQSIIASSADNLASKTVKFALGSIIPMAGGVLAEAYNTIKEGLSFVKTATGIGGIIIILLILMPGIIPLVLYKLSIITFAFLADMLNLDGISDILNDIKGIMEIIIAIVLYTSLMLIFAIILFTKSQVG